MKGRMHISVIITSILVVFAGASCQKESFSESDLNALNTEITTLIACTGSALELKTSNFEATSNNSRTLFRKNNQTVTTQIDFNNDGINDLEMLLINASDAQGNPNDVLRMKFLHNAWEVAYQIIPEKMLHCSNVEHGNNELSYLKGQQNITCANPTSDELKKKVYSKRFGNSSDLSDINWINSEVFLAKTVNNVSDKHHYAQHYYSGDWLGNSGVLLLKNATDELYFVELCVPLSYITDANGIKKYQILETSISSFGKYQK